ncbi:MAG: diguanylate cyclase [bacterium]|nr:diguanylate cyclase [bacterium]
MTGGPSPELLAEMLDAAPDAVGIMQRADDEDLFRFLYVNRTFERVYLASRDDVLGMPIEPFVRGRSGDADYARIMASLDGDEPFRVRRAFERPDGSTIWLEVHVQRVPNAHGVSWMFISRDVTREKLQHDRIVQLATAFEQGFDPIVISVPEGERWPFAYVNEAFTRVTGYLPEEVIGKPWDFLVADPRDRVRLLDIRAALFEGQQVRTELSFRTKDGRSGIFDLQVQPIRDPVTGASSSIVALFRDVTSIRQREQALLFEAEHDALTGLYNRRFLERNLETAIAMTRTRPTHALLFADLDGFKDVNDRLGHTAGDRVLATAAKAFSSVLFQTDVLARWGGDEFAALLFHCTFENALKSARAMTEALAGAPDRAGVTVSIGVVAIRPGESMDVLVRRADHACYLAKAAGRNQVYGDRGEDTE